MHFESHGLATTEFVCREMLFRDTQRFLCAIRDPQMRMTRA